MQHHLHVCGLVHIRIHAHALSTHLCIHATILYTSVHIGVWEPYQAGNALQEVSGRIGETQWGGLDMPNSILLLLHLDHSPRPSRAAAHLPYSATRLFFAWPFECLFSAVVHYTWRGNVNPVSLAFESCRHAQQCGNCVCDGELIKFNTICIPPPASLHIMCRMLCAWSIL